ncbi:MAG: hypothetical protein AB8G23_19270 [Myxococcota bacterium]
MESDLKEPREAQGTSKSGGFASVMALGIVFSLSLFGMLVVGSAEAEGAAAPYREGPLGPSAGQAMSWWPSALPPNADEFFALVCLGAVLVGFRWAGLAQRDRVSR